MTATATKEAPQTRQTAGVPALAGPRLPFHPLLEERFGVDRASWKALCEAIFPNATCVESIVLALSYCKARRLDPFKRVVHIVPIWSKELGRMMDTVWPGIGELRTTAFRTGEYAGRGATVLGPDITQKVGNVEMTFPEWAQVSVFRMVKGQRVEFSGPRVYWLETYATKSRTDDSPNEMWQYRPRGQIDKCAEAAALRAGFPEEVGSDFIPEEVQHDPAKIIDAPKGKTIEDVTARLETDQAPPLEPATLNEGEAMKSDGEIVSNESQVNPLAELQELFDQATSVADARALYDLWVGPESTRETTPEQRESIAAWRDQAIKRIEPPKAGKQRELAGAK